MKVACFCGEVIKGKDVTVCPKCLRPVELPTVSNPSGLRRPQG